MKIELTGLANYAARVVAIKEVLELPGMNTVAGANIFENHVIIGKDTKPGTLGVYFPVEVELDSEFVRQNNLYMVAERNADPTKKGLFDSSCRVRCKTFQKRYRSEGFFIPISAFSIYGDVSNLKEGMAFDTINSCRVCRKYTLVKHQQVVSGSSQNRKKNKKLKKFDRMIEGQFTFHIDTANLAYNIESIEPNDIISITNKIHGTSFIVSNVLTKVQLGLFDRIKKFLGFNVVDKKYTLLAASRTIIKNTDINPTAGPGFYKFDLWTDIARNIGLLIPEKYTVYGEAFGNLPTGGAIQKNYTYGCKSNEYRIIIYRITITEPDGSMVELTEPEIIKFCADRGLDCKETFYYGKASECFPEIPVDENWCMNFYRKLKRSFNLEQDCKDNPGFPAEGVVVRIDGSKKFNVFKCRSFRFTKRETEALDAGELDIESVESQPQLEG